MSLEGDSISIGLQLADNVDRCDTPSVCTTLSTISTVTATPLDRKYKYHLFFSYNPKDRIWVEHVIAKWEADPYNFKCCYDERNFENGTSKMQNILCSIMLSKRVILVLSSAFVDETWKDYEEAIAHVTSLCSRKQRVVPVILEECVVPESLIMLNCIDVRRSKFWDNFFKIIHLDGMTTSESLNTIRSFASQSSCRGYYNGQVLVTLSATIEGWCSANLVFNSRDTPEALQQYDINIAADFYADIIQTIGREDIGKQLPWLFTAIPTILLGVVFVMWCIAFILVIVLFPDDSPGTLPVRLCVFALPAAFIVIGCIFRWKKLKHQKEKFSVCMFSRSIQVNKLLHERSQPVIVASARTNDDTFYIYFLYCSKNECVDHIKVFLSHCTNEDIIKLSKLIEVYTLHSSYMEGSPIALRLAVMMCASYAIQLVFRRIPHSLEPRHTRRRQCLCQFVEEFLSAYLPCIRQEADLSNLTFLFFRYLNCHFKPEPIILHTLGIMLPD